MWILALLLAAGVSAEPTHPWRAYRAPEAGFAIELPDSPVRTRSSQLTPVGRVRTEVWVAFLEGTEFRVEVHDIPAVARWVVSERGLLERAVADLLSDEGASRGVESAERVGGHAARRVVYTDRGARPGEGLFVLADGRLFLMAVLWPRDAGERPGRERFFGSFGLLGASPGDAS